MKKNDDDEEVVIAPSAVFKSDSKRVVFNGVKGRIVAIDYELVWLTVLLCLSYSASSGQ